MAEGGNKLYDVYLVHSHDGKAAAMQIKRDLKGKGLEVYAYFDEGSTFDSGKPTVNSIMEAVNKSNVVLILLTHNTVEVIKVFRHCLKTRVQGSHCYGVKFCCCCFVVFFCSFFLSDLGICYF